MRTRRNGKSRKVLVHSISPSTGGLVIASLDRATHVSRIHHALEATTWGEFRTRVPRAEYARLMKAYDDEGEPRPKDADPFSAEQIPGFSDGDYPDWLQADMNRVLPTEIIENFAIRESSVLNGPFYMIKPAHLPAIRDRLEKLGYTLREAPELRFW